MNGNQNPKIEDLAKIAPQLLDDAQTRATIRSAEISATATIKAAETSSIKNASATIKAAKLNKQALIKVGEINLKAPRLEGTLHWLRRLSPRLALYMALHQGKMI